MIMIIIKQGFAFFTVHWLFLRLGAEVKGYFATGIYICNYTQ